MTDVRRVAEGRGQRAGGRELGAEGREVLQVV